MRWPQFGLVFSLCLLPAAILAQPQPEVAQQLFLPAGPLSSERSTTFAASPEDPAPEKLLGVSDKYEDSHFVTGNEWNLHVFEPHVRDLGGAYLGVGADQAYIIMGWMRPELAWLMDYDEHVVHIHRLHLLFFDAADTPERYLHLWSKEGRADALDLISRKFENKAERKRHLHRYTNSAGRVSRRLQRVIKRISSPCYLTDARQYEFLRTMSQEGRIRPLRANLLVTGGVQGIADAARKLNIPIRATYFSNAEEYWDYGPEFRTNVRALPADERSLVLRTRGTWESNRDYRYIVQLLENFQAVLAIEGIKNLGKYFGRCKVKGYGKADIMVLDVELPEAEAQPGGT